ncbi:unnamed protein product [Periconia digitata]|uniref:Uncharacterized protein n=1 Tax=Periconia digitata TaxID=1303443 RepID=A0A9W4XGY9_9PLEO|nr:unnamed protein product [Periconia digitata]
MAPSVHGVLEYDQALQSNKDIQQLKTRVTIDDLAFYYDDKDKLALLMGGTYDELTAWIKDNKAIADVLNHQWENVEKTGVADGLHNMMDRLRVITFGLVALLHHSDPFVRSTPANANDGTFPEITYHNIVKCHQAMVDKGLFVNKGYTNEAEHQRAYIFLNAMMLHRANPADINAAKAKLEEVFKDAQVSGVSVD